MNPYAPSSPQLIQLLEENRAAGRPHTTRTIALGPGAIAALPAFFKETFSGRDALLVCDDHTLEAAGHAVEAALDAAGIPVRRVVLEPRVHPRGASGRAAGGSAQRAGGLIADDHLIAEDGIITSCQTLLGSTDAIAVAVGAGTINDIAKFASFKLGREYIAIPTAASMNGYTSTIAAVLVGGVKRTLPCGQPVAIFADTSVLTKAPAHLNRAGFGDLLSKPVSQGDWLLSHIVRDVPYATRPNEILEDLFAELLAQAAAIGRADEYGLRVLMEAILVSGFSMAVAGSSAPASGGEHLVSHYWDMQQLDRQLPLLGLHGTQVGIATRLSAMLFERLLALDPATLAPDALAQRKPAFDRTTLDQRHAALSPSIVDEIAVQLQRKQRYGADLATELALVKTRWPQIVDRIGRVMLPVATIEKALRDAGCADKPSDIACSRERAIHALTVCRDLRDRYVALDLMDDLGLLEGWAADAVARAENSQGGKADPANGN